MKSFKFFNNNVPTGISQERLLAYHSIIDRIFVRHFTLPWESDEFRIAMDIFNEVQNQINSGEITIYQQIRLKYRYMFYDNFNEWYRITHTKHYEIIRQVENEII
jgi:hypothetical protein